MGSKGQGDIKPPNLSKDYEKGIQIALKYLPRQLAAEYGYRGEYDKKFWDQAAKFQEENDPRYAQMQLDALQRRDPQWLATHQALGDKIKEALDRGYLDPDQEAAYRRLAGIAGEVDPRYEAAYGKLAGLAGQVDPRQEAAYARWAASAGKGEPTRDKLYEATGKARTGDVLRGGTMSPEVLRQRTQALMAKQPGLSYGEAQDMVQSAGLGIYGEQLKQQRLQGAEQFAGLATPISQRQQSLAQFYGAPSIMQQRQQSLGQFSQVMDPTRMQQQSLGQFYGLQAPELQTLGLAGTYIQPSNTVAAALSGIPGIQAPRAMGYVNPNAGYQGAQYGLQNFQNQLASQQTQGGGGNPWMNALQGAGQGANYGGMFGGGYGAAGGAIVGGVAGAFGYPQYSDERGKINISRTRLTTPDGIPIVEYDYNGKRWRGVIAQEVAKVRPDAVHDFGNGTLGVFYSKLGIELEEV